MPRIFEDTHIVTPEEIDELGHASNVHYLGWAVTAAVRHSAAQGWTTERYLERGQVWVVREHQITYRRSALVDDRVTIRTWVANMNRATSLRRYEIIREHDGTLLAEASTNYAYIDLASGMPRRIPPELSGSFEIVPDAAKESA
ncbi:acyl-CoA thioesterase YbgC [Planctomycetes bacterium Pan216]|uniref:Acyl-CoA thioesterase YbgC n=1 Tax=Kolteria novifilia TaxID=2527975 RepID=A0A518B3F7_9BACT|nr:acyl-CoA thioesterase YbgC [Planctomycetes bacterium Pan216]